MLWVLDTRVWCIFILLNIVFIDNRVLKDGLLVVAELRDMGQLAVVSLLAARIVLLCAIVVA